MNWEKLSNDFRSVVDFLKAVVDDESKILTEMSHGNFDINSSMAQGYVGIYM